MGKMTLPGAVIVVSDRCADGEREDITGPFAVTALAGHGVRVERVVVVPEGREAVDRELRAALDGGARMVLTAGGTGIGPRNFTPEATAAFLAVELPGVATQILLAGLASTPRAGLSRGLVGVTGRGPGAALIVNAPHSRGGVADVVGVIGPLLPHILEQWEQPVDQASGTSTSPKAASSSRVS